MKLVFVDYYFLKKFKLLARRQIHRQGFQWHEWVLNSAQVADATTLNLFGLLHHQHEPLASIATSDTSLSYSVRHYQDDFVVSTHDF